MSLLDARGVPIAAGDTVIYGFGVGRSVAMAEAVVLDAHQGPVDGGMGTPLSCAYGCHWPCNRSSVSLTPSGRVRLRIVRRSYASGSKPVVDVAGDRLVVLKNGPVPGLPGRRPTLPESLLPTQDEEERQRIENLLKIYTANLRATEVPARHYYEGWSLERFHAYAANRLKELREELKKHDERTT